MKNTNFQMRATTLYGLEGVLVTELAALGAQGITAENRAVRFSGDKGFMYKANIALHTALRILVPIHKFRIQSEQDLYRGVKGIEWDEYLYYKKSLSVQALVHSGHISSHTHYIALKTKDAIVDYFKERYGKRPDVDTRNPDLRIHIHVNGTICTVSLDSSGEPLFKRGYRSVTGKAPVNEVLAAGMLLLAGYTGRNDFIDPMCGSGTIPIEAAFIATEIPPGIGRSFGFEKWENFDINLYENIRSGLLKKIREPLKQIHGYDLEASNIRKAEINADNAGLTEFIRWEKRDFFKPVQRVEQESLLLFNPPYDKRIQADTGQFYKKIGDTLKRYYPGSTAWMITPELKGVKNVGLRPSRKIKLYNGALECRLLKYDLYEGSHKKRKENEDK